MSNLIYAERKKMKKAMELVKYYESRARHHEKETGKPAHLDKAIISTLMWMTERTLLSYGIKEEEITGEEEYFQTNLRDKE